jgi:hypothetical protein
MIDREWINGKFEETDIDYKIAGKNILWKYEIEYLKKGVELLCKQHKIKSVLEFGFGMGWTATEFQKQGIERHIILEPNREIYQMALEWKKQYDTDIEILNIFSWDFDIDEKFDLVYDDRQQFSDECNKKNYKQMNKILKEGQLYTCCAVPISQKAVPPPAIYFEIDNKLHVQPLRKYNKAGNIQ